MISVVIRAATFTPMSCTAKAKSVGCMAASTFSSRARAKRPVRKRMRSGIAALFWAAGRIQKDF